MRRRIYKNVGNGHPVCHEDSIKAVARRENFKNGRRHHNGEKFPCRKAGRILTWGIRYSHRHSKVAKGLDFEDVDLVGVLNADQAVYNSDFRAYERAFSLLTQVIGRAGRASGEGISVLQTISPDEDIIEMAASQDYDAFLKRK